ncbi:MAG: hypothetical protein AAGB01_03385 [Cyanobacteria bacterium P01_F01_bin.42]
MTERLDRIEAAVEANSLAFAKATEERKELRELFLTTVQVLSESAQRQEAESNASKQRQDSILQAIHAMQSQVTEIQADVREMQAEVRGLQVENRRIIDRVFGSET